MLNAKAAATISENIEARQHATLIEALESAIKKAAEYGQRVIVVDQTQMPAWAEQVLIDAGYKVKLDRLMYKVSW